jgi:hypothetical protein
VSASRKRNVGMHTEARAVESNILEAMKRHRVGRDNCAPPSCLGYWGFPEYDFRWPQGAAFAVSKIVRSMEQRGVIRYRFDGRRGYYLPGVE